MSFIEDDIACCYARYAPIEWQPLNYRVILGEISSPNSRNSPPEPWAYNLGENVGLSSPKFLDSVSSPSSKEYEKDILNFAKRIKTDLRERPSFCEITRKKSPVLDLNMMRITKDGEIKRSSTLIRGTQSERFRNDFRSKLSFSPNLNLSLDRPCKENQILPYDKTYDFGESVTDTKSNDSLNNKKRKSLDYDQLDTKSLANDDLIRHLVQHIHFSPESVSDNDSGSI